MSQHDYTIDNQPSSSFRSDLNSALGAVASVNSGATAPATTYANMFWYDTSANTLWKRNEANSGWISLGTVDESTSKFEPNQTLASQAQAEAGTDNVFAMTALRARQGVSVLLGTASTASGASVTLSGLVLTTYRQLILSFNSVSASTGPFNVTLAGTRVTPDASTAATLLRGMGSIDLSTGVCSFNIAPSVGAAPVMAVGTVYAGDLGITTATTSLTFAPSAGTFDNGSIKVYGYR